MHIAQCGGNTNFPILQRRKNEEHLCRINSLRDENTEDRIINIASLNIILRMRIIVDHQHNITCQRKIVCSTSFSPLILLVAEGLTMFLHNLHSEIIVYKHTSSIKLSTFPKGKACVYSEDDESARDKEWKKWYWYEMQHQVN